MIKQNNFILIFLKYVHIFLIFCLSLNSHFYYHCLLSRPEKAMAPHSSTLAWKIPWTEEPGRLQSMRSLRVRHDWATSLSLFTFMHWRRKWQPPPVFLPGESQGQGSLVGCHLWGAQSWTWLMRLCNYQGQLPSYNKVIHKFWSELLKGYLLSCVQLFATPLAVVCQASLSMGFSRREY